MNEWAAFPSTSGSITLLNKALSGIDKVVISDKPFLSSVIIHNKAILDAEQLVIKDCPLLKTIQFNGGSYKWFKVSAKEIQITSINSSAFIHYTFLS